jgi:Tol biopolymer transport system component
MKLRVLIAGLVFVVAALAADSGAELFQKAVTQERAAGNLEEAIKLYQRVAKEFASDRPLAAKALVQAAHCYELLGQDKQDKAVKLYEQVARDFGDQRELSAAANSRLAVLRQVERAPAPATMTQRKIDLPFAGYPGFASFSTDGRREVYTDPATAALMIVNLAGTDKRVIFKPKTGEHLGGYLPSRDFSMVVMYLLKPDRSYHIAAIKIDGTGYRESLPVSVFYPGWSWDNRYLFASTSTQTSNQLLRASVADGEIRKVQENGNVYDVPSPDGRFIAMADLAAVYRLGRISIMPTEGGAPQLVADNARLIDWTRDGRYLVIASERSGTEALYLLPTKEGRPAGDPIFVRYGSFTFGRTTSDGSLAYNSTPQGGGYAAWLGALDSGGRPVDWKRLNLSGSSQRSFNPKWSPDSTQIIYVSPDEAVGKNTYALRLRNMASGEERELYRGIRTDCIWVAARPKLFCDQGQLGRVPTTVELLSISTDSGQVEPLGPLAEAWNGGVLFSGRDDGAIYMWRFLSPQGPQPVPKLIRWDIGTREATVVDRIPGPITGGDWLGPVPDEHWVARWDKGKIEIRPTPGGDWKPLISLDTTQTAFTPDGNWLLYHDVDAAGKQSLFRVSTAGGQPERIGDFPSASKQGSLRISPDGKKIIAEAPVAPEVWVMENFEPKQQTAK